MIPAQTRKTKKISKKAKEKGIGFTVCEGRVVEAIEQSKRALDVFYTKASKMPAHTVLNGVYAVNRSELMGVREIFEGLADSILSPKHKQARDICLTYLSFLESLTLSDKDDINDPVFLSFTSAFVQWLTATHNVMMDQSSWAKRKKNYDWFIEKYIDYAPVYIQEKILKETLEENM
jgi:hydroxymethylpyrimidine pyrophosphatase-like HAD family hydrolase